MVLYTDHISLPKFKLKFFILLKNIMANTYQINTQNENIVTQI